MNYNPYKSDYKKKGFFIINNFYTDDEVKKLKLLLKNYDSKKVTKTLRAGKILRLENLYHTGIYKIIHKRELINLFASLHNFKPILFKDKFIHKKKNKENSYGLHFDGLFKSYNYRLKRNTLGWYTYARKFFTMNVMLDDNNYDNGCLYVHNKLKGTPNELYKKYINDIKPFFKNKKIENKSKPIIASKGSILIFDNLCPHFSKNSTSKPRGNLYLTYSNSKNSEIYKIFNRDKKLLLENIGKKEYQKRTKIDS